MRRIWTDLVVHLQTDADWKGYGANGLLLVAMLATIYGWGTEERLAQLGPGMYFLCIWASFTLVYFLSVFLKTGTTFFKQRGWMARAFGYVSIIALSSSLLFVEDWTTQLSPWEAAYAKRILYNSVGSLIAFVSLAIMVLWQRHSEERFFGLCAPRPQLSPYFMLLCCMLPIIWIAAQQGHFLETYPVFRPWRYKEVFGLTLTQMTALFEAVYLFDFVRVEVLFRGALVIGLSRFLGRHSVLPMAMLYCALHLNKPLGEAVSSFFGGYLLGTIALYQRHILGGTIVHIGIAAVMEAIAFYYST